MSRKWQISRRTMLRGTGAALALPMFDVMRDATSATTTHPPVRFVTMFAPNGVYPKSWDCLGTGEDYELSPILEPLAGVKDDVIVISGLDGIGGGHVRATSSFLTGVAMKVGRNAISIDQHIASHIGKGTRLPSIELGTEPPRQGGNEGLPISLANTVSWSSATTRVSPEINPRVAFDRLFRTSQSGREAEDNKSVIDLVLEDAKRLRGRISAADRHKLDEYISGVRAVEKRIDGELHPRRPAWQPPTSPKLARPPAGIPQRRDIHVRIIIDLALLALQTDTTRVATLMLAHGFSRQSFSFIGVEGDHHTISHHKNQEKWTTAYTKVSRWYVSQFAYLLERMKGIDEGGSSLLNNSIVLYGSGLKDGNGHTNKNLPILVGGRAGGEIQTGRHIACPKGTPIANLHLTFAQRLGIDTDRFNSSTGVVDRLS